MPDAGDPINLLRTIGQGPALVTTEHATRGPGLDRRSLST